MKKIHAILLAASILFNISCSEDNNTTSSGPLTLHFDNIVGNTDLEINTDDAPYTNGKGEAYQVTRLSYYVSNIQLTKSDGSVFIDPVKSDGSAGYYLVNEDDEASQDITLTNIPAGDYTAASFTIGVDASKVDHNYAEGTLDPEQGMFRDWNAGFIFLALEGTAPTSTEAGKVFKYHLSGYKEEATTAQVNNLVNITLAFDGHTAPVRAAHEPEVHLLLDVSKVLDGAGEQVTFSTDAIRDTPKSCETLAGNLSAAFVVDHIHAN